MSGLLLGKLLYSLAELSPLFFVLVTHILSLHFPGINTTKVKYSIMFTYPGLSLVVLPSITIFATPSMRGNLKSLVGCAIPQSIPQSIPKLVVHQPTPTDLELASPAPLAAVDNKGEVGQGEGPGNGDNKGEMGKEEGPTTALTSNISRVSNGPRDDDDDHGYVKALLKSCEI